MDRNKNVRTLILPFGRTYEEESNSLVAEVKTDSTHPPPGLFTKDAGRSPKLPHRIAQRSHVRDADADLLPKSRREGPR